MKLYLIRHGMTAGNLEKRYVGSTDEAVLPESLAAIKQKKAPEVSAVYASPKVRCVQTANALFPKHEICIKEGLQECEFGEFEYRNYRELKENENYQKWITSGGVIGFPDGETLEAFQKRSVIAFLEIIEEAEKKQYESIALVVHGGTIMAVLDWFSAPHRDYFDWQAANAAGFCGILSGRRIKEITPYA